MAASILQEKETSAAASATTISLAFDSNVTAGSAIHVIFSSTADFATVDTCTVSDGTNSYNVRSGQNPASTRQLIHATYDNAPAGATTITVTFPTARTKRAILIREIGGVASAAYDGEATNFQSAPGTGTDAVTSGNITPSAQPGLISGVVFISTASFVSPFTAGTGFTSGIGAWSTIESGDVALSESKRYTSTSALAATFTTDRAGDDYLTVAALFKEASGTVNTKTLSDTVAVADAGLDYAFYNRSQDSVAALVDQALYTTIAVVQEAGTFANTATGVSRIMPNDVAADNLIVIIGAKRHASTSDPFQAGDAVQIGGTATIGTMNFVSGASTELAYDGGAGVIALGIWWTVVATAGSATFRIQGAASNSDMLIAVGEYSSAFSWGSVEASTVATETTDSTTTPSTGNLSSTGGGALFIAGLAISATSSITITPDSLFGEIHEEQSAGLRMPGSMLRRIVNTATTDAADWTIGSGNTGWIAGLVVLKESIGGTVNTKDLADTLLIVDSLIASAIRGRDAADTFSTTDGLLLSAERGSILSDTVIMDEGNADRYITSNLIADDAIDVTDGVLASFIGERVLYAILSSGIDVTDEAVRSVIRGRLLQDTITLNDQPLDLSRTVNLIADDAFDSYDDIVTRLLLTRLLGDSLGISDEVLTSVIGQNLIQKILSSSLATADDALAWVNRFREGSSSTLTSDQVTKVLDVTRMLTDAIETADDSLRALQRFILLTDSLDAFDAASASVQVPYVATPTIVIGFDQPRIEVGGYGL